MRWQLLGTKDGVSDFVLVFGTDDSVMDPLRELAEERDLRAASFHAIGAFRDASLAYFAWETREYEEIHVADQVEVVSLTGNIGREDSEVRIHAHCVLGRRDGSVVAGHLLDGVVRPTLELFPRAWPTTLGRAPDEESGLALIRPPDPVSPSGAPSSG
jgi:uncharacterized protein